MMTWDEWKVKNKEKIFHIVGFEEKFVDTVLAKITLITPLDVVPQFHFIDDKGINRYIDFMIINPKKGYCVPLELDGLTKLFQDGKEYHKFNDFLERQNSLISRFGLVLRYSNKKMLNESYDIVREITDVLNRQSKNKNIEEIKSQKIKSQIDDYEKQIKSLKIKSLANESEDSKLLISRMQSQLDFFRKQTSVSDGIKNNAIDSRGAQKNTKLVWFFCIVLFVIYFLFYSYAKTFYAKNDVDSNRESDFNYVESVDYSDSSYDDGDYVKACGRVAQLKEFSRGLYLNVGNPYPNQDVTIVVWDGKEEAAIRFLDKKICVSGVIKLYNNKPQIEINSLSVIKIE